ncbi:Zinc finger protein 620 [Pteropus alecto]|uniref:Zinc finger protein 620 n=1 Tax=Pteropus alecto TaxID=9402 RepID=L5KEJ5_PTEAL|nr:Zinc finger protein 620 [Pteropus alecto]
MKPGVTSHAPDSVVPAAFPFPKPDLRFQLEHGEAPQGLDPWTAIGREVLRDVCIAPPPLNSVPVVARPSLTRSSGIWASQKPPEVAARPSRAFVQPPAHRGLTLFSTLKNVA